MLTRAWVFSLFYTVSRIMALVSGRSIWNDSDCLYGRTENIEGLTECPAHDAEFVISFAKIAVPAMYLILLAIAVINIVCFKFRKCAHAIFYLELIMNVLVMSTPNA